MDMKNPKDSYEGNISNFVRLVLALVGERLFSLGTL